MPGCGVFSNSTSGAPNCDPTDKDASIHLQGSFTFLAGSVGTAGCVGKTGGASNIGEPTTPNATKTFTQKDGSVTDPYADLTIPTPGSPPTPCIDPTYPDTRFTAKLPDGNYPMTLPSGRYCSLTTAPTGAHLGTYDITLSGGVYVFDSQKTGNNTTVDVKGGSLVSDPAGPGVTLEFTSSVREISE